MSLEVAVLPRRFRVQGIEGSGDDGFGGEDADVGDKQVEHAVQVVVEEHRGRGVAFVLEAGPPGDAGELRLSAVLEQMIAAADRGREQVGVAVVVDVGEGSGHPDRPGQRQDFRRGRLEAPGAGVAPQLVAPGHVREVDVEEAVAVGVGDRDAVAVVVVGGLVALAGVAGGDVGKGDPGLLPAVGETEIDEGFEQVPALQLARPASLDPFGGGDLRGIGDHGPLGGRSGRGEKGRRQNGKDCPRQKGPDSHCTSPSSSAVRRIQSSKSLRECTYTVPKRESWLKPHIWSPSSR